MRSNGRLKNSQAQKYLIKKTNYNEKLKKIFIKLYQT